MARARERKRRRRRREKEERGGGEGYVSLGKLAEMSNSRALASNQRPNKTTLSRGASSVPPLPLSPLLTSLFLR